MNLADRPLLVLVPGLLCDATVWQPIIQQLGDRIQPWIGPNEGANRLEDLAAQLLARVPAPRFALAGHSMGGRIALEVMRQAPERVQRLALLDTGWLPRAAGDAGAAEQAQREALVALGRQEGLAAVAAQWLPGMLPPAQLGTPLFQALTRMVSARRQADFEAQVQALLHRPDAAAVLARIHCPTLVLCGREDRWSPPAQHEALAARIAGARLVLVDGAGHMCPAEQPAAVAEAFRAWLAQPEPAC